MDSEKMDGPKTAGASVGAATGFCCWFLLGFIGLQKLLIYLSGIWMIEPVLQFLGVHGQVNVLIPAFFVYILSFALYGWLLAAAATLLSRGAEQD